MNIREFTEHDTEELTILMKKLCKLRGTEFNEDRWRENLERTLRKNKDSEVIVAFNDATDEVIGMAQCSIRNSNQGIRFGYISNLIVREEQRGTGIGEALMRHAVDHFRRSHINSIRLALKSKLKDKADKLFKKLGFQEHITIYELTI